MYERRVELGILCGDAAIDKKFYGGRHAPIAQPKNQASVYNSPSPPSSVKNFPSISCSGPTANAQEVSLVLLRLP